MQNIVIHVLVLIKCRKELHMKYLCIQKYYYIGFFLITNKTTMSENKYIHTIWEKEKIESLLKIKLKL